MLSQVTIVQIKPAFTKRNSISEIITIENRMHIKDIQMMGLEFLKKSFIKDPLFLCQPAVKTVLRPNCELILHKGLNQA